MQLLDLGEIWTLKKLERTAVSMVLSNFFFGLFFQNVVISFSQPPESPENGAAHLLSGVVEFDDAYFGGPTAGGKRGRGTYEKLC